MAVWYNLTFAYKEILTSTKMNQLDGNFDALAEGVAGSPLIQRNALQNSLINVDKLDSGIDAKAKFFISYNSDYLDGYHASDILSLTLAWSIL
jgi:hypothetical protein